MKKLTLIVSFALFLFTASAQETQTWESLTKLKEKTDKKIQNPKKNIKYKTWAERGDIYYDCSVFSTLGLYQGMPASGTLQSVEFLLKKPDSKKTVGDKEIWIYPHMELTFVGGVLNSWQETQFIDKDAIIKSANAYIKATELDKKGKFIKRSSTIGKVAQIRGRLINEGVDLYSHDKFDEAYKHLVLAKKMGGFPKAKTDTAFDVNMVNFYCGIIAESAKMYPESRKHFKSCIKNKYQAASSYHHLASTWLAVGDSSEYEAITKTGFEQYPENEQLVIDLINFYMEKGESESVLKFLDVAINKNPTNASFYSAKASIYDNQDEEAYSNYRKKKEEYIDLKKQCFRARNKPDALKPLEIKRDIALKAADKFKNQAKENFKKAENLYKKSLEVNPKFFNANFNLGRLYYKVNERFRKEADDVPYSKDKDGKISKGLKDKGLENLKISVDYFLAAYKINPNDKNTLDILANSYYKLKDRDKSKEFKAKANAIKTKSEGLK